MCYISVTDKRKYHISVTDKQKYYICGIDEWRVLHQHHSQKKVLHHCYTWMKHYISATYLNQKYYNIVKYWENVLHKCYTDEQKCYR